MGPIRQTAGVYTVLALLTLGLGVVSTFSRAAEQDTEKKIASGEATPAVVRPGNSVTFSIKGLKPNSRLTIAGGDKAISDLFFGEENFTNAAGEFKKIVPLPIFVGQGEVAIDFVDEDGTTIIVQFSIGGGAIRPFLFGGKIVDEADERYFHITGVGWAKGVPIVVEDVDQRLQRKVTLAVKDQCAAAGCEREDSLDIIARLPDDDIPGAHRFTISQGTDRSVDTVVEVPPLPGHEKNGDEKPEIFLIDPPRATREIPSLAVRGVGWGRFEGRKEPMVWLIPHDDLSKKTALKVDRNYRDCTFVIPTGGDGNIKGGCSLESDEMFLRVEFTDEAKKLPAGSYFLYVLVENGLEALRSFELVNTPNLSKEKKPNIALTPASGTVGSYVIVTAGGFPRRTGTTVTLDGVKIGGTPVTDTNGFYDDVGIVIPPFIEKNKKPIAITPGVHTIAVNGGGHAYASAKFTVRALDDTKERQEKEKREREEKERVDREKREQEKREKEEQEKALQELLDEKKQLKKEREDLGKEQAELEKKKKQLDVDTLKEERDRLKGEKEELDRRMKEVLIETKKALEENERLMREERERKKQEKNDAGRVKKDTKKELELLLYENIQSFGKPCKKSVAITFQPGCVPPPPADIEKPYAGSVCDANIPRVWQEGCVEPPRQPWIPDTVGKACRSDIAITFQPGCIPQKQKELEKPFSGKPCTTDFPRVWQEGCVGQKQQDKAPSTPSATSTCNPLIPDYAQKGCK